MRFIKPEIIPKHRLETHYWIFFLAYGVGFCGKNEGFAFQLSWRFVGFSGAYWIQGGVTDRVETNGQSQDFPHCPRCLRAWSARTRASIASATGTARFPITTPRRAGPWRLARRRICHPPSMILVPCLAVRAYSARRDKKTRVKRRAVCALYGDGH